MSEELQRNIETFGQRLAQVRDQVTHQPPLREQLRQQLAKPDQRIWLCFIGGTLVWALALMMLYPLTSLTCHWGWLGAPDRESGLKAIQTLVTLVATGLIAGAGYVAYQEWQSARAIGNQEGSERKAAHIAMLAFITLLLNSLYLLIMLVSLAPILVLSVCQ